MSEKKRLVLFVEGTGDCAAAPVLINRMFRERSDPPWDCLEVDDQPPFKVGEISGLMGRDKKTGGIEFQQWHKYLDRAGRTRNKLGGVLLLLDGDAERVAGQPFCPAVLGRLLAEESRKAGGGTLFSVGVVFLCAEFESLFLASRLTLPPLKANPEAFPPVIESKRGVKEWLKRNLREGYKNTEDQALLTQTLSFEEIRPQMSSFRRLERALDELIQAIRSGQHIVSPRHPSSESP